MNEIIAQIPTELRETSWCCSVAAFITNQSKMIEEQSLQIAALKKSVQELRDEIARVKRLPKRPKFRPSGGKPRERSGLTDLVVDSKMEKLMPAIVHEEVTIKVDGVPEGSRLKGYQRYTVQELEIGVKETTYRLEVWQTPYGRTMRATLPAHLKGTHFGSELRSFIHNLYAGCMTEPEIFNLLTGFGVKISTGQIHNVLMNEVEGLCDVSNGILEVGLKTAPYICVDDTGARHEYKLRYCTQVGGQYFSFFKTTNDKSRANFLKILLQGKEGYCINEAFMRHMGEVNAMWKERVSNMLQSYLGKQYKTLKAMNALLDTAGITNKALRLQCIEAGSVGFISQNLIRPNQVLLSDRAGQFAILDHAACWVHMERPLRALVASHKWLEQIIKRIRGMIWELYDKVKIASKTPQGEEASRQKTEINKLYDELVAVRTNHPILKTIIESFANYRHELLKALDHPGLPLHTNASERDIRNVVKRRNVSGSTNSDDGKRYRDALTTIKQTCRRLGMSFFVYMKMWFIGQPIDLALIIRNKYQASLESPLPQPSG